MPFIFKVPPANFSLLIPNNPVGTTAKNSGWIVPPNGSTYIWDINNSAAGAAAGIVELQHLLTVTQQTQVEFTISVDNGFDLYINGNFIQSGTGFTSYTSVIYTFSTGTHRIVFHSINGTGPAGLAASVKRTSDNVVLLVTNSSWTFTPDTGTH